MNNKNLVFKYSLDKKYDRIYLDIESKRNTVISKYSDISPHDIKVSDQTIFLQEQVSNDSTARSGKKCEIWYPVVDIRMDGRMKGIFEISGNGNYQINKSVKKVVEGIICTEVKELEEWENILMVEGDVVLNHFKIRKEYEEVSGNFREEIELLSDEWEGKLILWAEECGEMLILSEQNISREAETVQEDGIGLSERGRLLKALKGSIDYIIRNQVKKADSIYAGGLNLFYDHDARTFRQPSWVWTWGPAVYTLLEAAEIEEITEIYSKEYLYEVADSIGKASLRFQLKEDPKHPAYGLVICRRDYDPRIKGGCMEFLSPPDSLFLAGWGWMALYRRTGDKAYLEATKLLVDQTIHLLRMNSDIIEQDYMIPANEWKDWILDEAGFGMKGFVELYEATQEKKYKEWGEVYISQILSCLEREDGLWNRMWTRSTQTVSEISYHTRAMGWAMEGLLSSYQLLENQEYLDKAVKMADAMLAVQNEDGSWFFKFDKGSESLGISEKGTAYWSGLLYRLYEYTNHIVYLNAARQALSWCVNNQYHGTDPDGAGGIIGRTPSSGVIYRRFFDVSCTYTSAFFGDALIRELT